MALINRKFNIWVLGNNEGYIEISDEHELVTGSAPIGKMWKWTNFDNLQYIVVDRPEPEKTPEIEQAWVESEFENFVDPTVMMIWSGDKRSAGYNKQDIKDYSNMLRDYVTNESGKLIINGERPPRPQKTK